MSFSRTARVGFNSLQLLILNFAFWIGVLAIAVIVLKIVFVSPSPRQRLDHSELMRQIDAGNIQEAKFIRSTSGVEIRGTIRNPPGDFKTTIAEGEMGDLTARLQSKGIASSVADEIPRGSSRYYATFGFVIAFFAGWFFLVGFQIKRLKRKALKFKQEAVG
jgi:ATP-dependent Zn protease